MYNSAEDQTKPILEKKQELEYLMKRFSDKVVKLSYYYLRDKHQAEDICQEVFIKVYNNLEKFRNDSNYYTWIYRITVNLCKDYLKSAAFRKLFSVGTINDLNISCRETNKMFEEVEGGEVFSKIMELPTKYRVPLSLHYMEGFSTVEIADLLKISESNVRVRLYRGREKLKAMMSRGD